MAEYKLSQRATDNLVEIYAYTELNLGRYQANAYIAGFDDIFELLAQFPHMGREAKDLQAGFRGSVFNRTTSSTPKKQTSF